MKTAKRLLLECVAPCVKLTDAIKEHATGQAFEDALRWHIDVYHQFEKDAARFVTGQPNNLFGSIDDLLNSFEDLVRMVEDIGDVAKAEDAAYDALTTAYLYAEGIANENH